MISSIESSIELRIKLNGRMDDPPAIGHLVGITRKPRYNRTKDLELRQLWFVVRRCSTYHLITKIFTIDVQQRITLLMAD